MTAQVLALPPNPSGLCQCGCGTQTGRVRDRDPVRGYQAGDFRRYRRGHHPKPLVRRGAQHHAWRGGRGKQSDGYITLRIPPDHEFGCMGYYERGGFRVLEHRLVMATHIGRPLTRNETVHHINGVRDDNRIENLQLLSSSKHVGGQAQVCLDCGSNRIAPVPLAEVK